MQVLTIAGHALAGAAFAALALLLLTRWRHRMQGSLMLLAVLATVAWAAMVVWQPAQAGLGALIAELAKGLAWIAFVRQAFAGTVRSELSPWLRAGPPIVAGIALPLGVWCASTDAAPLGVVTIPRTLELAALLLAILGFVYVEQALRNTRESRAWAAKFLWLGVGAGFVFDIALFSASYVLGALQPALVASRGFAFALTVPLLAIGVSRIRDFRPQVLMSQHLVFYTTSVVLAGFYLLGISVAGYTVRVLGGELGAALQVVLVFAALLALATVAFSGAARARLRVTLSKHWFPYKYDYRTEWLDLTDRLTRDTEGSSLAQRTLDAFQHLGRASGAAVLVVRDGALQPVVGELFAEQPELAEPANGPFCRFLEEREWILDLDRARAADGLDAAAPVPRWLSEASDAWLAVPLLHERRLQALVVLARPLVEGRLSWEDLDLLRTASKQAASYFALAGAADALAQERQFAAFNRFTAFLMHDLSNIVAQQRLIVENAARHKNNPAFIEDAIDTIDNTVRRIGRLLEQMKGASPSAPPRQARLAEVCRSAAARLADREPRPAFVGGAEAEVLIAAERLEHVLEHVIRNAQDATPPGGSVTVSTGIDAQFAVIEVADTGRGMEPAFVRDRLFRPFDTTKGAKGMGIGAFETREFVRAAGGDVRVRSTPGAGTTFVIRLPRIT